MGAIIPLPVRIILFPVFKINFELLGKNEKQAGAELGQAQVKLEVIVEGGGGVEDRSKFLIPSEF